LTESKKNMLHCWGESSPSSIRSASSLTQVKLLRHSRCWEIAPAWILGGPGSNSNLHARLSLHTNMHQPHHRDFNYRIVHSFWITQEFGHCEIVSLAIMERDQRQQFSPWSSIKWCYLHVFASIQSPDLLVQGNGGSRKLCMNPTTHVLSGS